MGGVYNPFNLNLYAYSHQNPVKLLDPDGEAVGAAVRAFKLIKKAYKVYKKEGKLTRENLKKAGLDELIDFAGDLYTLFDENASLLDKAEALSDITIGTEFSNKGAKEVKRIVDRVIGKKKLINTPRKGADWIKLKGKQGWKDSKGNIWKKDTKHKDHWDVSDKRGKKIKEVDFEGNVIWPGGPKNKNRNKR